MPTPVNHKIHHHGVVGVVWRDTIRFQTMATRLHEHDEKASNKCPHEVDGDTVLANLVCHVTNGQALF